MASLPSRITALLTSLTRNQVAALSPAQRQLFADQCERVLHLIEQAEMPPKSGILADLRDGKGRQ